jgi:hypothetical protein
MKILGKPYAGKLHVRFDEGKEEVRSENVAVTLYRLLLLFYSTGFNISNFEMTSKYFHARRQEKRKDSKVFVTLS